MEKLKIYFMTIIMFFIDVFNTIINYFLPYKSVLKYNNNKIEDITIFFYLNYFLNLYFNTDLYLYLLDDDLNNDINNDINYHINYDINNDIYRIQIRKTDRYFIYSGKFNSLIFSNKINDDDNINQPRNLFIKYKIFINGLELKLEDKILCKKHYSNTKLVDFFKFNKIINLEKMEELIIYKNDKEFKKYNSDIFELTIKDIYIYL